MPKKTGRKAPNKKQASSKTQKTTKTPAKTTKKTLSPEAQARTMQPKRTRTAPSFKTQARSTILTAKVFVDGKAGQSYSYKWEGNQPADRPKMFRLAYIDATYDELRLSDVPRYWSDFARPARDRELRLDKHTRALFHFNGDIKGQSYGSTDPLPARLE